MRWTRLWITAFLLLGLVWTLPLEAEGALPDTEQSLCFDTTSTIDPPQPGEAFYGQDAQYSGFEPSYTDNGDGTVTDLNTGLMWQQALPPEKMTWEEAMAGTDTCSIGGYTDWRLPTIKELYSLILFSGTDPSGPGPVDPVPFIDTDYFEFEYGDTLAGERLIDAQYWSSTVYKGLTFWGDSTAFGVNFADGRIKGYPSQETGPPWQPFTMTSYVRYVRGEAWGQNQLVDNGDGTVTDAATGLVWQQADDGVERNWEEALAYAESLDFAGCSDWRLPNAHELQSIVDYTRSVQQTGSPAIDPVFDCTQITDEGGDPNYGFYWTGTTHQTTSPDQDGAFAVYIAFGEGLGWQQEPDSTWTVLDVHGAGCQRSDPKCGDPDQWPHGNGPQGDVVRIYNLVRCVRDTGTGIGEADLGGSNGIALELVGPNPVSGSAVFDYRLSSPGWASIRVFDMSGRVMCTILDEELSAVEGSAAWDASESPPGDLQLRAADLDRLVVGDSGGAEMKPG